MGNKIMKICLAILMSAAIVILAILMVMHIREGLVTQNAKMYMWFYVILIVWAAIRLYSLIKEIRK
jgi:hypothetical protein